MADESDRGSSNEQEKVEQRLAGQQSHESEYGEQGRENMADQGAEGSFGGESAGRSATFGKEIEAPDGTAGQPIGGNDSSTGSGTTLTQGADFEGDKQTREAQASGRGDDDDKSAAPRESLGDKSRDFGEMTTSNAGGSAVGTSQTSGVSSGVSGGEGFTGSQAPGSEDGERARASHEVPSGAAATGGSDFAKEGRGALEDEEAGRAG